MSALDAKREAARHYLTERGISLRLHSGFRVPADTNVARTIKRERQRQGKSAARRQG